MNVNFYKIICNNTGAVYVGSTIKTIEKRLRKHEKDYRYFLNGKYHFVSSFIILEGKNYAVQLIDTIVCTDRKHRDTLERLHILNEQCVNKYQPGRDAKQWRSDNKEKIHQYYTDNKEKILQYQQEYREENKEQIQQYKKQYREENKEKITEKHKQYYHDNKEQLNEKHKQYYTDNKAKIRQQQNEKFNCLCGGKYIHANKARHMKSKKHIAYLATL